MVITSSRGVGSTVRDGTARLSAIHPKVVWGSADLGPGRNNLIALADNEYVLPVGCGLLHFDNASALTRKARLVPSTYPDVEKVLLMALSTDAQFLATSVALKNQPRGELCLLIFYAKGHMDGSIRPRLIRHAVSVYPPLTAASEPLSVTALAFSHDSMYLACATNHTAVGTLVFDFLKGTVFQTITSETVPQSLSFHPADSGKMVAVGENSFVRFWRFNAKSVHVAPVTGLRRGSHNYCAHAWLLPYSESAVVIGSESGFLSVVQNCEQRAPSQQVFGSPEYSDPQTCRIAHLLVRGDNVIVASPQNQIALYEVRRVVLSKAVAGLSATLVPLAHYRLNDITALRGLTFALKNSVTSYSLMAATERNVALLEIITDHDLSGGNEQRQQKRLSAGNYDDVWASVAIDKPLFSFHSDKIQSLSVSSKGRVFMTSSFHDGSLRMWDYENPSTFRSAWLIESFADRAEENPFHAALHPSGLQVAAACEAEVREYAVGDNQLDLVRSFGVRTPFTSHTGQPVVISQPVSLVKYSHGGHLLAVVTGKLVQIFHMLMEDADRGGAPFRMMTLCDHVSTVTDIVFLRDDQRLVTVSNDGCVYSWVLGSNGRDKEYIQKGIPATKVCVSTHHADRCTIAVCFEGTVSAETTQTLAADVVRKRRQTSIAMRSASRQASSDPNYFALSSSLGSGNNSERGIAPLEREGSFFHDSPRSVSAGNVGNTAVASAAAAALFAPATTHAVLPGASSSKNFFVAFWENEISANPRIAHSDTPIKAIALGRTPGPDSIDICAMGLADGRVLVCTLPVPLFSVTALSVSTSLANTKPHLFRAGSAPRGVGRKKKGMQAMESLVEAVNEAASPTALSAQPFAGRGRTAGDDTGKAGAVETVVSFAENTSPTGLVNNGSASDELGERTGGSASANVIEMIDESRCKTMRLFVGPVSHIDFSQDAEFIFVAGEDRSVHLLAMRKKISEDLAEKEEGLSPVTRSQYLMMEKSKMQTLRSKLRELETAVELSKKENKLSMDNLVEDKNKEIEELKAKHQKEIQMREANIVAGRNEYIQMKKNMQAEIATLKSRSDDALSALELLYEKKLAQESVYLEKMRQAYDEYVVHSRMDIASLQRQTEARVQAIEADKAKALGEAEKQKLAVLQYYEYIKDRNNEVIQSLEEQQAEERLKLRVQLSETGDMLLQVQAQNMAGELQASRTIQKLKFDLDNKDMEVMRVNSDIDWANDRIQKVEQALERATLELKARSELVEKWETKTVELTKKIEDLEKIRKTLTTQLNMVQGELDPREKELNKSKEKLQEMNREYEIALHAITEKEKILNQRGESLLALQKQVRDLRITAAQKETLLRRAALFLDEFVYAMNEARFAPVPKSGTKETKDSEELKRSASVKEKTKSHSHKGKKTDGLLAALNLDPTADNKLKQLHDILKPYIVEGGVDAELIDEMENVRREQERHVTILHRNFHNLQSSLESAQLAAATKVANHLSDNQTLLNEVNNLRNEVRALSLENHHLSAQLDYQATKHQADLHAAHSLLLNSETDERYESGRRNNKQKLKPTASYPINLATGTPMLPKIYTNQAIAPQVPASSVCSPSIANSSLSVPELEPPAHEPRLTMNDSIESVQPEFAPQSSLKKKSKRPIPTIQDLLSTHTGASRGQTEYLPTRKDRISSILSQSAPSLDAAASTAGKSSESRSGNAADRKIAAIIELNLEELSKAKKGK